MAKLRYDLVAEAIGNLQKYMDSCAEDTNTARLIRDAESSIKQLKAIEHKVKQRHEEGKPIKSDFVSAMDELQERMNKVRESMSDAESFMKTYHDEITTMKGVIATTIEIGAILSKLRSMERNIEQLRSRVVLT